MAEKNSITADELESINPLISTDGNTFKVSAALVSLADMLSEEENRKAEHDSQFGYGVACILETCAAALLHMENIREEHHGNV